MRYSVGIDMEIIKAAYVPHVQTNNFFNICNPTQKRTAQRYELVMFLKSGGATVINGKRYPITAGSIRFIRPGDEVYSYRYEDIYMMHFIVKNQEQWVKAFAPIPSFISLPDVETELSLFPKLIAAFIEQKEFECMSILWLLLSRIKAQHKTQRRNNTAATTYQIKKYIDENYSEQLTLEKISQKFHMHPVHVQRKFKKELGISPCEYQKKVRLAKAVIFLRTTDLSIEEISELCGFSNASHFISVFKTSEQMTPLQYRQKNNNLDILL